MMKLDGFSGKRICVAVSGGVDSLSLTHYLKSCEEKFGYQLSALHCEHGIRGEESVADKEFVVAICKAWNIPLTVYEEDCPALAKTEKCSLETAARNFRYRCFSSLINENKTDYIATAHHADDEAETILFRLARGTSLSGVKGMTEQDGFVIRPFLHWTRAEIERYAEENALKYRQDKTNFELNATRNKLRLQVLPSLENAVPGASENLVRFARIAAADDELLYRLSAELLSTEGEEKVVAFSKERSLFCRASLLAMKALGVEKDYTALHLEKAFLLQQLERGSRWNMPKGVVAEKKENGIAFYIEKDDERVRTERTEKFEKMYFDGGCYEVIISETLQTPTNEAWNVLRVDGEKIPPNAVFRFRKEGDTIERFGGGRKSLKKFFNEKKTPVKEREYLPLIAEEDGSEVYVVCGIEISEKVKTDESTQKVLYITIRKKGESLW